MKRLTVVMTRTDDILAKHKSSSQQNNLMFTVLVFTCVSQVMSCFLLLTSLVVRLHDNDVLKKGKKILLHFAYR